MGRYLKEEELVINGPWVIGDNAILSPAALTGAANDYDPVGWRSAGVVQVSAVHLSTDGGNYNLTGMAAPSPALRNMIFIQNVGASGNITLVANSASSVAENRFDFNGNTTLQPMEGIWMVYNTSKSRWTEIARAI